MTSGCQFEWGKISSRLLSGTDEYRGRDGVPVMSAA